MTSPTGLLGRIARSLARRLRRYRWGARLLGFTTFFHPTRFFHSERYLRQTARRLEHLATLGIELHSRTVLEVGAGIGDLSHYYLDRGCKMTISDAREENLEVLRSRYPGVSIIPINLENPRLGGQEVFEVVHCYGLLYHLSNPVQALDFLSSHCSHFLLLETCVSFGNEDAWNFLAEDTLNPTQAVSGTGCRPTRLAVLRALSKNFQYVYLPRTQPNHDEFPIDWDNPQAHNGPFARAIFVASRVPIESPELILCEESLPPQQARAD